MRRKKEEGRNGKDKERVGEMGKGEDRNGRGWSRRLTRKGEKTITNNGKKGGRENTINGVHFRYIK